MSGFKYKVGRVELCNVPIPVRESVREALRSGTRQAGVRRGCSAAAVDAVCWRWRARSMKARWRCSGVAFCQRSAQAPTLLGRELVELAEVVAHLGLLITAATLPELLPLVAQLASIFRVADRASAGSAPWHRPAAAASSKATAGSRARACWRSGGSVFHRSFGSARGVLLVRREARPLRACGRQRRRLLRSDAGAAAISSSASRVVRRAFIICYSYSVVAGALFFASRGFSKSHRSSTNALSRSILRRRLSPTSPLPRNSSKSSSAAVVANAGQPGFAGATWRSAAGFAAVLGSSRRPSGANTTQQPQGHRASVANRSIGAPRRRPRRPSEAAHS